MTGWTRRAEALVLVTAVALCACGGNGQDGAPSTSEGPGSTTTSAESPAVDETESSVVITVTDLSFPAEVTVPSGKSVIWVNESSAPHEVQMDTFDGADIDMELVRLGTDQQGELTLEPGTWTYFCTIHPSMTGSLIVEG